MRGTGRVEAIHITAEGGASMKGVGEVEAVAGRGLRGDRYFNRTGTYSGDRGRDIPAEWRAATLIESEALETIERDADVELSPSQHRRNITTKDVAVDHLVDQQFRVGEAVFEGAILCEPCSYLQEKTDVDGVVSALTHRGGLNAKIVESGMIQVGDEITPL